MSAPLKPRAFRKALDARSFASAYLFVGDDDFQKEQAVRHLVAAAVDEGLRDFNYEVRRGPELDAGTLGSLLETPPMMADQRVVVVRDVGGLKKDARAELERWLRRPAPDVVAVLVAAAGAKDRDVDKLRDLATCVEFAPLTGEHVTAWITHWVETELQGRITPEAADLLHAAVGTDLPQLAAELDKLLSFTNGAPIDDRAVSAIVGVRRGETMGDLLDAVARHEVRSALALVPHVLQQPKVSGVTVVMALTTQTLALGWAQAAIAERLLAPAQLQKAFFDLLKDGGGAFTGRPWNEAVQAWTRAPRWSAAAVDRALEALLAADVALKESTVSGDEQIIATLVLALCTPDARAAA
jgi:DNA polymerase-3 subunit delta